MRTRAKLWAREGLGRGRESAREQPQLVLACAMGALADGEEAGGPDLCQHSSFRPCALLLRSR
eukprot:5759570-Prymnesium_polylepis.1